LTDFDPLDTSGHYGVALGDMCDGYLALRPPRRLSVAEGAAQALVMKRPGDAATPWSATDTPYMVEPMNMLASRHHAATAFVGPAQSGKTAGLLEGWMAHAVTNDPGDMLIVQMTEAKAREYSKQRIDRALRHSPKLAALMGTATQDNTHDKSFRHGMWLRIAWPTVTNLSSTSYRYVALTDYDRMPDDIDGEGDAFSLGIKRTTTFMSRGMCAVESSPGRAWSDPGWRPSTPHEAPPVGGILGIYNRSDRRRWYWPCLDCREWFEAAPGVGLFNLPPTAQLLEEVRSADIGKLAKHYAKVVCPHCGSLTEARHRYEMNRRGVWVPDGASLTPEGDMIGTPATSTIAGYWLGGVAAAYQSWENLLNKHLQGMRDYAMTGNEESLRVAVNTDQAMPYIPMHLVEAQARAKPLEERGEGDLIRYTVPAQTRCLVASVDVQGGSTARFVVQIHAVGPHMEQWLVDRHEIRHSEREGMGADKAPIDPATYAEDWDVLTERLLRATWRTPDAEREIKLRLLVVDTGGEDGATANAYAWFRRVRNEGLGDRVMLYKGANTPNAPILKLSRVGKIGTKDKGDVPLYLCNPNLLSDAVDAGLRRTTPGPGYLHFPPPKHPTKNPDGWLQPAFFDELKAEQRDKNGRWQQVRKRNESFDLCRMIRAGLLRLKLDKIRDWNTVPEWLAPLEQNSEIVAVEARRDTQADERIDDTPAEPKPVRIIGKMVRRQRRSATSPYLV
jgi:phage terminase large subunit GpA-like protein